jgi:hypothetical protein
MDLGELGVALPPPPSQITRKQKLRQKKKKIFFVNQSLQKKFALNHFLN